MSIAPVIALVLFVLLSCLFAFVKGGAAERIGAATILANLLGGALNEYVFTGRLVTVSIDGLTALILLIVAMRYASFWLGGVMLLYAVQFGLHAYYLVLERPEDLLYLAINNINFLAICLCLVMGTTLSIRQRRADAALEAAAPTP